MADTPQLVHKRIDDRCGISPQRVWIFSTSEGIPAEHRPVFRRTACTRTAHELLLRVENAYVMKNWNAWIEDSKQAVHYWWLLLLVGAGLLLVGILTLLFPVRSYLGLSMLFGWVILLAGALEVVLSTSNRHLITGRGWMLAGGIIEIILGVILVLNLGLSASTLPLFLGFWLLMRAFATIGLGGDMRALQIGGSGWTLLTGILLLVCSLWILIQPSVGTAAAVLWVGISLLFAGAGACSLALQLRRAHRCFGEKH